MKRKLVIAVFALVLTLAVAPMASAQYWNWFRGFGGFFQPFPDGRNFIGSLYLFQENPETGVVVQSGAWGKMTYNFWGSTFNYIFDGYRLDYRKDYTLIYLPDLEADLSERSVVCLGTSTAFRRNVFIAGRPNTGDLPGDYDWNYGFGAQIVLVPSSDVDCEVETVFGKMNKWEPALYLFGYGLIRFEDTNDGTIPLPDPYIYDPNRPV
jgi:hypothetical protein